jgi:hypothetical protein
MPDILERVHGNSVEGVWRFWRFCHTPSKACQQQVKQVSSK